MKGSDSKQISVDIFKVPKVKFSTTIAELTENQDYDFNCDVADGDSNSKIRWIDQDGNELSKVSK